MTEPTYYALVNGIRTPPGSDRNWTNRGVTWLHNYELRTANTKLAAECIEYHTKAVLRWARHDEFVYKFGRNLDFHRAWKQVVIAAHSNGANVVLDALRDKGWPAVEHLHLISPACEQDLGYLVPQLGRTIKRLTIWIGEKDIPLRLAGFPILGKLMGYDDLGLKGPEGIPAAVMDAHVQVHREPEFGHSTWFDEAQFERTMLRIVGGQE